ncbi:MAG TPA: hypothetical protein VHV77_13025, partial [Pirellulales bacterium]|nr:hypothetical protein [Pirellulales bacterium]
RDHYDFIFSNSVIEHVGNLRSQHQMAKVIEEVGTYYWVQTPAKSFPLEPHFYFPFFAYLPLGVRTFLYRNMKLGFMGKEREWLKAKMACEETRLLTKKEFEALFSSCRIIREKVLSLTKSYIATNMDSHFEQVDPIAQLDHSASSSQRDCLLNTH